LPGRLWYQRLKFNNKFVIAAILGVVLVEYLSLPLFISLPKRYYLSFNALTVYVGIVMALLMIFYPPRLMLKLHETLEDLKGNGIISKKTYDDTMRKTNVEIYGRKEKYLPPLFATVTIIAWIYDELSRGVFGVFDFTDMSGNVVRIWSFPFTLIHDTFVMARVAILVILAFSTLLVAWEVSRSIGLISEHVEVRIVSPDGTGGLGPIGKLMAEVILLVITLPSIWAILCAAYFMITGMLHPSIGIVVILGYTLVFALIPHPLFVIHKVMAERKKEALNQITHKNEKLRRKVAMRDVDDAGSEMILLSSLLVMLGEVRRMHTVPFETSSVQKIAVLIFTPFLTLLSIFLETYVGSPFGFLALVAIGILSIVSQFVKLG